MMSRIDGSSAKSLPKLRRGEYRLRKIITWLRYRWAVILTKAPGRHTNLGPNGLPLPPGGLIHAVAGSYDTGWFLESGALAHECLISSLQKHGVSVEKLTTVLDFGCGCGRVARHWQSATSLRFHGVDTNRDLVRWCQKNLVFGRFSVNAPGPPLHFDPQTFDLVYGFSVLTHLSEDRQLAWMREFERVLKPQGVLVISTHGKKAARVLPGPLRTRFDAGELVVTRYGSEGGNDCNAFHPRRYFTDVVARAFECVAFQPEGALGNPPQDLYLLRRRD
jgi:ubiquinone/menaquinone biosynthesis C-methylase UbiE